MQPGKLACIAGAAFAVAFAAGSQGDDQTFIKEAVQGHIAEIQLGELAAQRAQNEGVRKFGAGSQFDAAFVSHMVTAHEAAIAKYSRSASSNNAAVASLVADSLPKLKAHLEMAQALQRGEPAHSRH